MNCLWLGPSITLDAHRYILLYHYQDRFREIRRTETVSQPQTACSAHVLKLGEPAPRARARSEEVGHAYGPVRNSVSRMV